MTSSSNHYLAKNDSNNNVKDLNNLILDKLNLFKVAGVHMNDDEDDDEIDMKNIQKQTTTISSTQNEVLNENNNHNNIMVDSISFDNVKLNNNNSNTKSNSSINNIDLSLINTVHVCAAQVRRFDNDLKNKTIIKKFFHFIFILDTTI